MFAGFISTKGFNYPSRGFQIEQEIPADVWVAFELLVRAGYDKYLIEPQIYTDNTD